jgi:hypothetical protein
VLSSSLLLAVKEPLSLISLGLKIPGQVNYITYGALEHGSTGLVFWKRKALFFPHHTEIVRTALPPDFNEEEYLSLNPDVAQIGDVPAWHYQHHGAREGRKYRKEISSTMSE